MNVIEVAKAAGGVVVHPYDYGASPDSMVLSFESLERFAQIIRNQALEDAAVQCDKRNHAGDAGAVLSGQAIRAMKKEQS